MMFNVMYLHKQRIIEQVQATNIQNTYYNIIRDRPIQ